MLNPSILVEIMLYYLTELATSYIGTYGFNISRSFSERFHSEPRESF